MSDLIRFFQGGGCPKKVKDFMTVIGDPSSGLVEPALCKLVKSLKSNGFWNDIIYLYPYVGTTATQHSYNLKDTSLYQLSFLNAGGEWTNSGYLNGGNNWARTQIPAAAFNNEFCVGSYFANNIGGAIVRGIVGRAEGSPLTAAAFLQYNGSDITRRIGASLNTTSERNFNQVNNNGFLSYQRTSTPEIKRYRNGVLLDTQNGNPFAKPTHSWWGLGQIATSTGAEYSAARYNNIRRFDFATNQIFTDAQQTILYNIIQEFQTNLGRAV